MNPGFEAARTLQQAEQLKFLGLPLLLWIPLLPLIGALINLTIGRKMSRGFVHVVAVAAVAAAFGISLYVVVVGPLRKLFGFWQEGSGILPSIKQTAFTWIEIGDFKAELAFRLDTLSAVMIMVVTFVGTLIHIYSTGYMAADKRPAAYFGYLNLFTGSMLILVLGANLPVMFIGWEGVGLCSFLLIGFWFTNDAYAYAGRKAFVVNRIGDFCFLLGMFLLFWATKDLATGSAGSLDFDVLRSPAAQEVYTKGFWSGERLAMLGGVLLFIGACGKSAQIPLYTWLPDAMAGPTPVSALIHAATMVTAGVYMVCRLSFLFASSTTALAVVATIGALTALAAAFMAFAQTDMKRVLAYSTVSQLGFMFVAAGTGNWAAAMFHLTTHAFFKAGLFLGAGSVMHGMEHGGSQTPGDITTMGGLRKKLPITHFCYVIYCLAIAGFPLIVSGFYSKDEILGGAFGVHPPAWPAFYGKVLWAVLVLAALGTAFYMWRLYFLVFAGKPRSDAADHAHESPPSMTIPLLVLAFGSVVLGFFGMPHVKKPHLPDATHFVTSWMEPSVTNAWNPEGTPIQPIAASADKLMKRLDRDPDGAGPQKPDGALDEAELAPTGLGAWLLADDEDRDGKIETSEIATRLDAKELGERIDRSHHSDAQTLGLMGVASLVGLLGIFLAWVLYGRGPSKRVEEWTASGGPLAGAYQASKHKLWVDEIYDAIIVRPFKAVARGAFEILDRFVIDTVVVNGSALVMSMFSRIARWMQNGQVQRYLLGVLVGAAAVFALTAWRFDPTFRYRRTDAAMIELRAEPGEGVAGIGCKIEWDLDNDGTIDATPEPDANRVISVSEGRVGGSVRVVMKCPGGTRSVTRTTRIADLASGKEWR
jgi:NADH-quinone oxidoreductase subunit L